MEDSGEGYAAAKEAFAQNQSRYNPVLDEWAGYSILCPSMDDAIIVQGTPASMLLSSLLFQINRCSNTTLEPGDLPCKPADEIDKFI